MSEPISSHEAQNAFDLVNRICTQVGPGNPGSPQERARAEMIKNELEILLGEENVSLEDFEAATGAFVGALPVSAVLMLAAAILNISAGFTPARIAWLPSLSAWVFSVFSVVVYILEFMLFFEFIDRFFEKKKSVNVVGRLRKPGTVQVKNLLIISAHHDSAFENTWLRFLGYGFFFLALTQLIAFAILFVMTSMQWLGVLIRNDRLFQLGTIGWIILVYPLLPTIIYAFFFSRGRKNGGVVPGAVDNLSSCALLGSICGYLVKNLDSIPAETEIRFISFGCEEAGLRGSRCYVARHMQELQSLDTRLLNIEMVAYPEITILASDMNGAVKHSPQMVKRVAAAAERASLPFKIKPASLGTGTDAAPFSQVGIKATTLMPFKMPQQTVAFYHQEWDTPENLNLEALNNVLKLTIEWVRAGG